MQLDMQLDMPVARSATGAPHRGNRSPLGRRVCSGLLALLLLPSVAQTAAAQSSTVTFENRSQQPATVKLLGQTVQSVDAGASGSRTIQVLPGQYTFEARIGAEPSPATYIALWVC